MKYITLTIITLQLMTACSQRQIIERDYKKSQSYNHKPYLKLKERRELKRLRDE